MSVHISMMTDMTHQLSILDDGLNLLAELAAGAYLGPEEVPGGQVTHGVLLLQSGALGALAGARRTQEHRPDAVGWTVRVRQGRLVLGTNGHGENML